MRKTINENHGVLLTYIGVKGTTRSRLHTDLRLRVDSDTYDAMTRPVVEQVWGLIRNDESADIVLAIRNQSRNQFWDGSRNLKH